MANQLTSKLSANEKYRLLIISHVKPFPAVSGQQNRVKNILLALSDYFTITFLTFDKSERLENTQSQLLKIVDDAIVLPSLVGQNVLSRIYHRLRGSFYNSGKGLKYSNYAIGEVELSPPRVMKAIAGTACELALFEYWHGYKNVSHLQRKNIPCILDMHDILWRTYELHLKSTPNPLKRWRRKQLVEGYKRAEEFAWKKFDGLIAISRSEAEYVRKSIPQAEVFSAFMGIDIGKWNYRWAPVDPPRFAYYGNMSGAANISAARRCARQIMPQVWDKLPQAELWIVGGNPTPEIIKFGEDSRIKVTGFVKEVAETLSRMTAVLCPWEGEFGFRSRLIEAMAVGCPLIATPEAIAGMDLVVGAGVFSAKDNSELAEICLRLAQNPTETAEHSRSLRRQVEAKYTFEATYGKLARELYSFVSRKKKETAVK